MGCYSAVDRANLLCQQRSRGGKLRVHHVNPVDDPAGQFLIATCLELLNEIALGGFYGIPDSPRLLTVRTGT